MKVLAIEQDTILPGCKAFSESCGYLDCKNWIESAHFLTGRAFEITAQGESYYRALWAQYHDMMVDQHDIFAFNRAQTIFAACIAQFPLLQAEETVSSSAFHYDADVSGGAIESQIRWKQHHEYMRSIFGMEPIYRRNAMLMTTILSTLGLTQSQPTGLEICAMPCKFWSREEALKMRDTPRNFHFYWTAVGPIVKPALASLTALKLRLIVESADPDEHDMNNLEAGFVGPRHPDCRLLVEGFFPEGSLSLL